VLNGAEGGNTKPSLLRLGPWEIDVHARTVSGPIGIRRLEPKPLSLLLHFATRVGIVVSRQELLAAAWGEEMATDDVLSRAISELRRALGDDPRQPAFIETIRGTGYRLLLPDIESVHVPPSFADSGESDRTADPAFINEQASGGQELPVVEKGTPERKRYMRRLALAVALTGIACIGLWQWNRRTAPQVSLRDPHLVPVTSFYGEVSGPRLSPDGTRLAYAWSDSSHPANVFVQGFEGSRRLQITNGNGRVPVWSPDGSRLAFLAKDGDGTAITEISSLGGSMRVLARIPVAPVLGLDWSPDGRYIAFSSHDAPFSNFRISLLQVDSLAVQPLTSGADATVGDAYPAFSPDGRSVAFARFVTETSADVHLIRTDTRIERRLTFDEQNITALTFAADGESITFASNRDGSSAIWDIEVDGGRPRRVLGSDRSITGLTYARESGALMVSAGEHEQHLWLYSRTHSNERATMLMPTTRADGAPSFAPNNRSIAFISDRSGASELWMTSVSGDSAVQLTQTGGFAGTPSWSPDGSRIVVARRTARDTELWLVDVRRRTAERMHAAIRSPITPSWSRDGRSILASSKQSGAWELWRLPLDGGAPRRLTEHGGIRGMESADGGQVLFTKPTSAGLWSRDVVTGAERLLVPSVPAGDWTNWSVGPRSVFFVERDSTGQQRIVMTDIATGAMRVLLSAVHVPIGIGGIAISSDEQQLVFGQVDRRRGNVYRAVTR
jgi:Tol biopolymer transport system component/DNA-binding winged helix-turn-helix (wHTH) protein